MLYFSLEKVLVYKLMKKYLIEIYAPTESPEVVSVKMDLVEFHPM
jgi:hypothetical protein